MKTFHVIYLGGMMVGSLIRWWSIRRMNRTTTVREDVDVGERLLMVIAFLGLQIVPLVFLFTPLLDFANVVYPSWIGWVGTALFCIAIWLLWRSHIDLGSNWSSTARIQERQQLVTRGVYSRIRHPMYAAHWLWGVAQLCLLDNWIAGPALIVTFAPLYFVRVQREERLMAEEFGDAYREYSARTGGLWPQLRQ